MSTVSQKDSLAESTEMVSTTVALPKELWKRVKIAATEYETSAQYICAEGLELVIKKYPPKKGKAA